MSSSSESSPEPEPVMPLNLPNIPSLRGPYSSQNTRDALLRARQPPNASPVPTAAATPVVATPQQAPNGGLPVPGLFSRTISAPSPRAPSGIAARRNGGMKLNMGGMAGGAPRPGPNAFPLNSGTSGAASAPAAPMNRPPPGIGESGSGTIDDFKDYLDAATGNLKFAGEATLTNKGVEFANGKSFAMSLDEVDPVGYLGRGNYGTVYKVRHARPRNPRSGPGLSSFNAHDVPPAVAEAPADSGSDREDGLTGILMAMKEIRVELNETTFKSVLKELTILYKSESPFIIDFYGAFFVDGAVYLCIEYMDGGSVDNLFANGTPEGVLRKIAYSTIHGLKTLKDVHNIIHRDVKPTNILLNSRGQVKICDFGVSGNLVQSVARTKVGCQSYMAPERITGGTVGTYNVISDVWSLGITLLECATGKYPYPPECMATVFALITAIISGDPPTLPAEGYSPDAHDFISKCLVQDPSNRWSYAQLLEHPWLAGLSEEGNGPAAAAAEDDLDISARMRLIALDPEVYDKEVADWVKESLERKAASKTPGASL